MSKQAPQPDRRVTIVSVNDRTYDLSFFYSWDRAQYGVSIACHGLVVDEVVCKQQIDPPELPEKRLCEAFWAAFADYANGNDYYDPVFAPRAPDEARRWGLSLMRLMQDRYVEPYSKLCIN